MSHRRTDGRGSTELNVMIRSLIKVIKYSRLVTRNPRPFTLVGRPAVTNSQRMFTINALPGLDVLALFVVLDGGRAADAALDLAPGGTGRGLRGWSGLGLLSRGLSSGPLSHRGLRRRRRGLRRLGDWVLRSLSRLLTNGSGVTRRVGWQRGMGLRSLMGGQRRNEGLNSATHTSSRAATNSRVLGQGKAPTDAREEASPGKLTRYLPRELSKLSRGTADAIDRPGATGVVGLAGVFLAKGPGRHVGRDVVEGVARLESGTVTLPAGWTRQSSTWYIALNHAQSTYSPLAL